MTDSTPSGVAAQVASVDEAVMQFLPFLSTILGFIPQTAPLAAPITAGVGALLKTIDDGAKTIASSKPGASAADIIGELVNHNTPGQPNSPALS